MEKIEEYLVRLEESLELFNSMLNFEYLNITIENVKDEYKEISLKFGELMMLKEVTLWFEHDLKEKAAAEEVYVYLMNELKDLQKVSKSIAKIGKDLSIKEQEKSKLRYLGMVKGCIKLIELIKNNR